MTVVVVVMMILMVMVVVMFAVPMHRIKNLVHDVHRTIKSRQIAELTADIQAVNVHDGHWVRNGIAPWDVDGEVVLGDGDGEGAVAAGKEGGEVGGVVGFVVFVVVEGYCLAGGGVVRVI